jgi:hypothetical protein
LSLFQHNAAADPIAYAEQVGQYVRVDLGAGTTETIGSMTQYFFVGSFADDDFSQEYAIDYPFSDLYSIDTATAATTLIGNIGLDAEIPTAMQWDPVNNYMLLLTNYGPCDGGSFYALDITTGATTIIGTHDGCLSGLAFDSNDNAYSIDVAADTLVEPLTGTIGPLGFNVAFISAFFFDPSTGVLYLIAQDVDLGSNNLYIVDTTTGLATLVAPWGVGYTAFALANPGPDTDTIFASGFDSPVQTPR